MRQINAGVAGGEAKLRSLPDTKPLFSIIWNDGLRPRAPESSPPVHFVRQKHCALPDADRPGDDPGPGSGAEMQYVLPKGFRAIA
jgi:hypothetical protein